MHRTPPLYTQDPSPDAQYTSPVCTGAPLLYAQDSSPGPVCTVPRSPVYIHRIPLLYVPPPPHTQDPSPVYIHRTLVCTGLPCMHRTPLCTGLPSPVSTGPPYIYAQDSPPLYSNDAYLNHG